MIYFFVVFYSIDFYRMWSSSLCNNTSFSFYYLLLFFSSCTYSFSSISFLLKLIFPIYNTHSLTQSLTLSHRNTHSIFFPHLYVKKSCPFFLFYSYFFLLLFLLGFFLVIQFCFYLFFFLTIIFQLDFFCILCSFSNKLIV